MRPRTPFFGADTCEVEFELEPPHPATPRAAVTTTSVLSFEDIETIAQASDPQPLTPS